MEKEQYNIDLASRQIEINDWSYKNKLDTLFVFQVLFISLLFLSVLFYLKSVDMLGGFFVWYVFLLVFLVVGLLIILRAMATHNRVDKRFWSRRRWDEDQTLASPLGRNDPSYLKYVESVRQKFGTASPASCKPCAAGAGEKK